MDQINSMKELADKMDNLTDFAMYVLQVFAHNLVNPAHGVYQ